jgi:hypothetical protein
MVRLLRPPGEWKGDITDGIHDEVWLKGILPDFFIFGYS